MGDQDRNNDAYDRGQKDSERGAAKETLWKNPSDSFETDSEIQSSYNRGYDDAKK